MRNSLAIILGITLLWSCTQIKKDQNTPQPKSDIIKPVSDSTSASETVAEFDDYGFRTDTVHVTNHKVQRNESLYLILDKFDFSAREIFEITQLADDLIDLKSFKPGQPYRVYASLEDENTLARLVWQPNPVDYVVFDWQDSLKIYKSSKIISSKTKTASGEIKSSLYEAMQDEELSPMLAYKLSEIYAWEIDFFSLRSGDRFRMVYEERYINGEFFDIGDIKAVEFTHRGEVYPAFQYQDKYTEGYFDGEGNSVQKALLKAPFKYSQRISSGFSHNRFHPVLKRRIPHYGVDYAAPHGTPVLSTGDGTITEARYRGANGNIVKIRHNGTYETAYLHLSGFARGIRRGVQVKQGQVIGYVGKTGRVTGTHLDYRIYRNGSPVNPLTVDLPSSESIPEESLAAFDQQKNRYLEKLDQMYASPTLLTGTGELPGTEMQGSSR